MVNLKNLGKVFIGAFFGLVFSMGIFLNVPPMKNVWGNSCDDSYIIERVLYCIDGSTINDNRFRTYCDR